MFVCFSVALTACATAYASAPPDDIVLRVDRGTNPGEANLNWTGGIGPFTVYRSISPIDLTNPANVLGTTGLATYVDADVPAPSRVFYYQVKGTSCASDAGCPTGHCVDGVCCTTSCTGTCLACNIAGSEGTCTAIPAGSDPASECGPGAACDGAGTCLSVNGQACGASSACVSGNCVDGFCCNTACDSLCQACSAARKGSGPDGACGNIASGTDPDIDCPADPVATCGRNGVCSGAGACQLYVSGSACGAHTCSSGIEHLADECDGAGTCVDGGVVNCAPYTCGPTSCDTSCTGNSGCVSGDFCDLASSTCGPCQGSDAPDLTFTDSNCDGIDGDAAKAIFVDVVSGNDGNSGTQADPKKTIVAGITAAAAAIPIKAVYVSKGTYPVTVALSNGVSVFGGYDAASDWARSNANVTTIASSTSPGVSGSNLVQAIELQLLTVTSPNVAGDGASSIGVRVINSSGPVTLRKLNVSVGNGSAGVSGVAGASGAGGGNGGDAGGAAPGAAGSSSCSAAGGTGGTGVNGVANGNPGQNGANPPGVGAGALGGNPGAPGSCSAGSSSNGGPAPSVTGPGTAGSSGSPGSAGSTVGSLDGTGFYNPPDGGAGTSGTAGGGGGGGGSGGGTASGTNIFCVDCGGLLSGGGGGGGGGGCGGHPGTGGHGGGGSFAVVSINSTVILDQSVLTSGHGGGGGNGGTRGSGGAPGIPGNGAAGQVRANSCGIRSAGAGADGSAGGPGNFGGGGAGGTGGPSICIAYKNQSAPTMTGSCTNGVPGNGGGGGSGAPSGPSGITGTNVELP